jgi:predicted TIM-barrel fold metal-dependent hydrolase
MTGAGSIGPVFDIFGSLPTVERLAFEIRSWGSEGGYSSVFADRWSAILGVPADLVARVANLPDTDFRRQAIALLEPVARPLEDLVLALRQAGVERTVLHNLLPTTPGLSNDDLARHVQAFPDDLIGFARVDPTQGQLAADEVRRCVQTLGFRGATITPFWHRVRANDPVCWPLYRACSELGVPIWIHTSINWVRSAALSFEHPLFIDEVAAQFPELTIIVGHGGWPWIADMVAVAWRQPNVYVDTSAFRPKHLAVPNSGWDMLWHFMSRTLRQKVLFGSTWSLLGMALPSLVDEVHSLGLPAGVERAWLHDNAARILP